MDDMEGTKDIVPELLAAILEDYEYGVGESRIIDRVKEHLEKNVATYIDANDYAIEIGEILSSAYAKNISSDILPDGRMYYNIADRTITPTITKSYEDIASIAAQVQSQLNKAAGIGIKPIEPEINQDRVSGIINRVSNADVFDDVAWLLSEPIINLTQSIVDDFIKVNSEFHGQSGMTPKIVRKVAGGCCDWCVKLAGTYTYPDVPKDVYRRHRYCRCTVDYDPGNGKVQNVHSKKWQTSDEELERRKSIGLDDKQDITLSKGVNVTDEYEHNKYPGQGKISIQEGYDSSLHVKEIETANWMLEYFGGEIQLLKEININKIRTPDYLWNNKFWELKSTSSEKAANTAIRKGIKQIRTNPGGIILNYEQNNVNINEVVEEIEDRIKQSGNNMSQFDVLIVRNNKLELAIRY